jgi:hypothetical protein
MLRRVVWAITLVMEAASTSETSGTSTRLDGATSQKAVIFMLAVHENLNQVDNVYFDFILLFSQP